MPVVADVSAFVYKTKTNRESLQIQTYEQLIIEKSIHTATAAFAISFWEWPTLRLLLASDPAAATMHLLLLLAAVASNQKKKKNQNNETPKISQMRIQISISKSGPGRLVREGATSFLGLKVDKAVAAPAPAPPWILAAIFFSPGRVTKRRNRRTSENSCEIDFFCKNK